MKRMRMGVILAGGLLLVAPGLAGSVHGRRWHGDRRANRPGLAAAG